MRMLLKAAAIRGVIPLVIMSAISLIMHVQELDANQVRSTFITGLIIAAIAAATVVEGWSLQKQSVVHRVIMTVTVFPCLMVSGWFSLDTPITSR